MERSKESKDKIPRKPGSGGWNKGFHHSEETKRKIGDIHRGKILSEELKQRLSIIHKELGHKPPSPLGIKRSEETCRKIGLIHKGKKRSDETKKKISENHRGMEGKHHSEETRKKMSKSMNRPEIKIQKSERMRREDNPSKRPEVQAKMRTIMLGRRCPWIAGENSPNKRPENREKSRERMKNGGAAHANSFIKNPSKSQVQLFERVKILYPSAILNYPCKNYSIDIAIPNQKIAIEYDEPYWHKGREEMDRKRQEEIEKEGWKFFRYNKLPDNNLLNKDLEMK